MRNDIWKFLLEDATTETIYKKAKLIRSQTTTHST